MALRKNFSLPLLLFLAQFIPVMSYAGDTVAERKGKQKYEVLVPYHRNVIKFNPTPMLIWGEVRNITLSYERLVAKNKSVSLQLGYLIYPTLLNGTVANLVHIEKGEKYGLNLAMDYRYYPSSRNRRPAPDGLYIGPYLSFYTFQFSNRFDILYTTIDQGGELYGRFNIVNLGFMIGYQFIFWKRFTLDMLLFGPSVSNYSGKLTISGNLDPEQIQHLDQEMVDKLLAKYPFLNALFSNENLEFTGNRTTMAVGLRYSIQLGFHF
jgi:hypothetical protein